MVASPPGPSRTPVAPARLAFVAGVLLLPLLGLGLLMARPELDVEWQHQPSHFWLVLTAGALNAVLA